MLLCSVGHTHVNDSMRNTALDIVVNLCVFIFLFVCFFIFLVLHKCSLSVDLLLLFFLGEGSSFR